MRPRNQSIMLRRVGNRGEWIRNTSAHESSRPGSVGTGMELQSHSIVVIRAVSVGSNATRSPGITPMRNCTYFSTGISGSRQGRSSLEVLAAFLGSVYSRGGQ